jgi:hypothetical protein
MPNKPRNSDGTIRQTNKPRLLTNRSIIARWVEAETLHLKRLGMSYQVIADHIVGVAHGQQQAMVSIPEPAPFTEEYSISAQAERFGAASPGFPIPRPRLIASSTPSAVKTCSCPCSQGFARGIRAALRSGSRCWRIRLN